jgi:hypothetical protein
VPRNPAYTAARRNWRTGLRKGVSVLPIEDLFLVPEGPAERGAFPLHVRWRRGAIPDLLPPASVTSPRGLFLFDFHQKALIVFAKKK